MPGEVNLYFPRGLFFQDWNGHRLLWLRSRQIICKSVGWFFMCLRVLKLLSVRG